MEMNVAFHYRGVFFSRDKRLLYRKGELHFTQKYDSDVLSFFELIDILKEGTGVDDVAELWYLPSGKSINEGLRQLNADADILSIVESMSADKVANVYVVHHGGRSPASILSAKEQLGNDVRPPLRRSPRNVLATNNQCMAIVLYEGGNCNVDQSGEDAATGNIPTQGSANVPKKSVPQPLHSDDLDGDMDSSSYAGDDFDCSVKDCDYEESDEDDDDLFFETEEDMAGETLAEDITREFDFKKVNAIEDDPDSDVQEESDGLRTPEGSEDDERDPRKFAVFNHLEGFTELIHIEVGMLFASKEIFKKAITQYSVERGGDFYYLHNDRDKVNVLCKYKCDCPWKHCRRACGAKGCGTVKCRFRAAARLYSEDGTFQLKSLTGEHTCGKQFFIGKIRSKYLAEKYIDHYRDDPEMKLRVFINTVRRDLGVKITYAQACRTRKRAYFMIQGDAKEQYALVCDYAETMIKYRVATPAYVHCIGSIEKPIFQRLFVCLKACSRGFFIGCRRLIGVDGCHLRGAYSGQILSAVGKDANENIYPVAYAVVESECKETWGWFLENLMPECSVGTRSHDLLTYLA